MQVMLVLPWGYCIVSHISGNCSTNLTYFTCHRVPWQWYSVDGVWASFMYVLMVYVFVIVARLSHVYHYSIVWKFKKFQSGPVDIKTSICQFDIFPKLTRDPMIVWLLTYFLYIYIYITMWSWWWPMLVDGLDGSRGRWGIDAFYVFNVYAKCMLMLCNLNPINSSN